MNKDLNKIFNGFINDEYINIEEFIKNNEDLFHCSIYYKKYNKSINSATAKVICEYQKFIYDLASYTVNGKKDNRCLTKEQRNKLEIAFQVEEGSSLLNTNSINQIKELLKMIPEKDRLPLIIIVLLLFFAYKIWNSLLNFLKEKEINKQNHEEKMADKELMDKAMDKISKNHPELANIYKNTEKNILNELPEIDDSVTYQGTTYSADDLKKIKDAKYPKTKHEKELKSLEGNFTVTQINIKKHYIYIEDENEEPQKILYNDDLVDNMQGFKDKFKKAIDDEGKVFYIKAGYLIENNRSKDLILYSIQEI